MDREIPWNTWGSFGINLALGSKLDQKANFTQYMYLPDYVYSIFKNSAIFIENQPKKLIKREDVLLEFKELKQEISIFNPFLIFSVISFIGLFVTFSDFKNKKRSKWMDFIVLFITGLIGCVICFLWFFTNHSTAPNNFNFLWAFFPNVFIAFILLKKKLPSWVSQYNRFILLLLIVSVVVWLFGIQQFSIAIIPILALLFLRNFSLFKFRDLIFSLKIFFITIN